MKIYQSLIQRVIPYNVTRTNFVLFILITVCVLTSKLSYAEDKTENYQRLVEFLSIPNFSANEKDINANIGWLRKSFTQLGFSTQILKSKGNDHIFAELNVDTTLPTVLFYMHFDGQPVEHGKWTQANAYQPTLKYQQDELVDKSLSWEVVKSKDFAKEDIRIYARSASDDKGPIAMFISALHGLKSNSELPKFNIKVILDSMEEVGSPFLESLVNEYKDTLSSDYFVVFDGPMHDSGNPTLLYGVRGVSTIYMEVYGMHKPQHSGHYGNYGPNPVFRAAEILHSFKDKDGKVLIDGYYDGIVIDENARKTLKRVPDDPHKLRHRAGFAKPEKVANNYQEAMQYPSLNVRGLKSAWVGDSVRTVVPDKVIVEMDLRTVPESDPYKLVNLIKSHIEELGYSIMADPATRQDLLTIERPVYFTAKHMMFPFRTEINSTIGGWLRASVSDSNKETVQIRMTGGSVPLSFFINALNVPTVLVPLVNPDNNQHSPNENLRLFNYFQGIKTIERVLTTPIKE